MFSDLDYDRKMMTSPYHLVICSAALKLCIQFSSQSVSVKPASQLVFQETPFCGSTIIIQASIGDVLITLDFD